MKLDNTDIRHKKDQLTGCSKSYKESIGNIYQWVKEDKISPAQMADLVEHIYKYFNY